MIVKSRVSLLCLLVASLGVGGQSCADMKDADPCYRFARVYCEKTELDEDDCRDASHDTCNDVIGETGDAEPWDECAEKLAEESECVDLRGLKSACPELPASLLVSRCGLDGSGASGGSGGSGAKGGAGGSGGSSAKGGTGGSGGSAGKGGTGGSGGSAGRGGSAGKGGAAGTSGAGARGGLGGMPGVGAASGRGGSGGFVSAQGGMGATSPFGGRGGSGGEAGEGISGEWCAVLYVEPSFDGEFFQMERNSELAEFSSYFDDNTASAEVFPGCQLVLFSEPGFEGVSLTYQGENETLGLFEYQASSALCECETPI